MGGEPGRGWGKVDQRDQGAVRLTTTFPSPTERPAGKL